MKLFLFNHTCSNCGNVFGVPVVSDFAYGQFVIFSQNGKHVAYLDTMKDIVFDEVSNIFDAVFVNPGLSEIKASDIFQKVFSVACDLSLDNEEYQIGSSPACPKCGCQKASRGSRIEPTISQEIPEVTHENWNKLSSKEKNRKVKDYLEKLGI